MPRRMLLAPRGAPAETPGDAPPKVQEPSKKEMQTVAKITGGPPLAQLAMPIARETSSASYSVDEEPSTKETQTVAKTMGDPPLAQLVMPNARESSSASCSIDEEGSGKCSSHEAAGAEAGPPRPAPRKRPLLAPAGGGGGAAGGDGEKADVQGPEDSCYTVAFTRAAHKKQRRFENGVLLVRDGKADLYNEEGKRLMIGRALRITEKLPVGRELYGNANTVLEVESEIPLDDFYSGRAFKRAGVAQPNAGPALQATHGSPRAKRFRPVAEGNCDTKAKEAEHQAAKQLSIDGTAPPDALILSGDSPGLFLDPSLSSHLRQHQREGICFMDKNIRAGMGCILADSMGLGKTLQALCLVWAALSRPASRPLCRKVAVVCPSSLCGNWEEECRRWLGPARVRPTVVQGGTSAANAAATVRSFLSSGKLLIISYDQLRQHADIVDAVIDLLVCDEGHRLKSAAAATTKRLAALKCKRRVLLTGTPLQNNLDEFWCCLSFVQPALLPPLPTFQRIFKRPIDRAQDASASTQEVALGNARSAELAQLASSVILRRGPELLETLLPPRTELLVTVPLTVPQVSAYRALCRIVRMAGSGQGHAHLEVLGMLRQLCNIDASQLRKPANAAVSDFGLGEEHDEFEDPEGNAKDAHHRAPSGGASNSLWQQALSNISESDWSATGNMSASAKLSLLEALLRWCLESAPKDGIVIVSGFSKPLEECAALCRKLSIPAETLTGATPIQRRVELVNTFNSQAGCRAFLLSSRAGGVGLNIVGANRLVLLEPDWNPAVDLQAMGRIWRQGQAKHCFVYRLAAHGTLEEKILQRQARKQGLATVALADHSGAGAGEAACDMAELRRVFELDGYGPTGQPAARNAGGTVPELPAAAGLGAPAVRAALHGVRLLGAEAAP